MIIGLSSQGIRWTALKTLCLILSVAGTFALIMGLFLIDASLSVFSVKSIEIINALTDGGRSACQYPVDIYPKPIKALFMFIVPFALALQVPACYMLDKPLFPSWPSWTAFIAPLSGALFFLLGYAVFRGALRHYRSTGS